jgi:hypothetical protein
MIDRGRVDPPRRSDANGADPPDLLTGRDPSVDFAGRTA